MIYEADQEIKQKVAKYFTGMEDTTILSCLQGHMGKAWVNNRENPEAAQIMVGDFTFFAGNPAAEGVEALLKNVPEHILAIVDNDEWKMLIEEVHKGNAERIQRHAFRKEHKDLDSTYLRKLTGNLPVGYELRKIDKNVVSKPSLFEVSPDFIKQFDSIADFLERGIGFAILFDEKVVSAAASYSIYDEGIEIEIVTDDSHRNKGLATCVAAALIVNCLERGQYPSWDAANLKSAKLATKLGYVSIGSYDTYYIHTPSSHFVHK
ncbi:GNAT family N-acetyltransferase [Oceanobacillus picturae]|uniref:GNAT family N-acetyltransferase n=1 Tax=Oceanobacillus picturae TaxID=171693 RepID=UPI0036457B94